MSTNPVVPALDNDQQAIQDLHAQLAGLNIVPADQGVAGELKVSDLRRGKRRLEDDSVGLATLVDVDGVWFWQQGMATRGVRGRRAGTGLTTLFGGTPLTTVKFEKLGKNKIAETLYKMDMTFTPYPGLREYKNGALGAVGAKPVERGRILLFVHGTFSNNDNLFKQLEDLKESPEGPQFLNDITKQANGMGVNYDQVLTFDHYTVSRSPLLNALDLARFMSNSTADIDIICHSRGGLVTRWFMEVFDRVNRPRRRAVMVGSPLRGTSLAAPDRVRNGIHLFANMGKMVGQGLSLIPFAQVAGSLMQIVFSLGDVVAKTPVLDAAVAMIPGLAAMSRVENNFELHSLKDCANPTPEYSAVTSIFEPEEIGWKFWRVFCGFGQRVAGAADNLIFRDADGTPCKNDLVVDTSSMTEYGFPPVIPPTRIMAFDETKRVYHTVYFREKDTIKFIRSTLGIQ